MLAFLCRRCGADGAGKQTERQFAMRPQTKLSPEAILFRQMLMSGAVAFVVGFVVVGAGVLWLHRAAAPERFWTWELIFHVLSPLHFALLGGLGFCVVCCSWLSRRYFRRGHARCPYCARALQGIGISCTCPESA